MSDSIESTAESNNRKHVVVVGAGLAGLGAAYELSKHENIRVTVLEQRDRVGGRVHSEDVKGHPVDFGGFIIYPWYENFLRVMQELHVDNLLENAPLNEIYYQIDDSGTFYTRKTAPFSTRDTIKLTMKMVAPVLRANDVANPPLENFGHKTVSEYFRDVLDTDEKGLYEAYADTVGQGYCYPASEQFRMSFMVPFIRMSRFHGDVKDSFFIRSGNNQVPNAMMKYIMQHDGELRLGETAMDIRDGKVITDAGEYTADAIVLAHNVDSSVYKAALPGTEPVTDYTHFYTITTKLSAIPSITVGTGSSASKDQLWCGAFYQPNTEDVQITSAVNLATLYNPELQGYINFNVVVRNGDHETPWTKQEALEIMQPLVQELFDGIEAEDVEVVVHWPKTMPIMTEEFVQHVRDAQGKNGIFYAGDFLGAPSMETALTTGVRAAEAAKLQLFGETDEIA